MENSLSAVSKKTYDIILDKDEDNIFFARCKELHANSEGDTDAEALFNVKEAIDLVIKDLRKSKDFTLNVIRKY